MGQYIKAVNVTLDDLPETVQVAISNMPDNVWVNITDGDFSCPRAVDLTPLTENEVFNIFFTEVEENVERTDENGHVCFSRFDEYTYFHTEVISHCLSSYKVAMGDEMVFEL